MGCDASKLCGVAALVELGMLTQRPRKAVFVERARHVVVLDAGVAVPLCCSPQGVVCFGWHGAMEARVITYDVWEAHPCSSHISVVSVPCKVGDDGNVVVRCLWVRSFVGAFGGVCLEFPCFGNGGLCALCICFLPVTPN